MDSKHVHIIFICAFLIIETKSYIKTFPKELAISLHNSLPSEEVQWFEIQDEIREREREEKDSILVRRLRHNHQEKHSHKSKLNNHQTKLKKFGDKEQHVNHDYEEIYIIPTPIRQIELSKEVTTRSSLSEKKYIKKFNDGTDIHINQTKINKLPIGVIKRNSLKLINKQGSFVKSAPFISNFKRSTAKEHFKFDDEVETTTLSTTWTRMKAKPYKRGKYYYYSKLKTGALNPKLGKHYVMKKTFYETRKKSTKKMTFFSYTSPPRTTSLSLGHEQDSDDIPLRWHKMTYKSSKKKWSKVRSSKNKSTSLSSEHEEDSDDIPQLWPKMSYKSSKVRSSKNKSMSLYSEYEEDSDDIPPLWLKMWKNKPWKKKWSKVKSSKNKWPKVRPLTTKMTSTIPVHNDVIFPDDVYFAEPSENKLKK